MNLLMAGIASALLTVSLSLMGVMPATAGLLGGALFNALLSIIITIERKKP